MPKIIVSKSKNKDGILIGNLKKKGSVSSIDSGYFSEKEEINILEIDESQISSDLDSYSRDNIPEVSKENEELQKKFEEISNIILPNTPFDFFTLKIEIEKLKNESLNYQVQVRKTELETLVDEAKRNLGKESKFLLDILLEVQSNIITSSVDDSKNKSLENLQTSLSKKLDEEKIRVICQKRKEITQLERAAEFLEISPKQTRINKSEGELKLQTQIEIPPKK